MTASWEDPRVVRGMTAQLEQRRARLAAGEKSLGWKVGFGAPAVMERLKITAPLVGFLTDRALMQPGVSISTAGWVKPVAEPEVAVTMGRDLSAGASREDVKAAITSLGPALEIADVEFPPEDVERILAGNIYQRGVILGPQDKTRGGVKLDGMEALVLRKGVEAGRTTDLQANTGDIIDLVKQVADTLAAFGEMLKAGEVIIPGSVVPPIFTETGDEVTFELKPVGAVTARFVA